MHRQVDIILRSGTSINMLRRLANCLQSVKKPLVVRALSTANTKIRVENTITLLDRDYPKDEWTNIGQNIIEKVGRNLHVTEYHPLSHIRCRIIDYFYKQFHNRIGNATFSVYDDISPIVTTTQQFDSLLIPKDHTSRRKTDCYYVNRDTVLRAHTTAHQSELIAMGLNNFLVIGDVYRKDEIDRLHFPVFHQADAVRLRTAEEVFRDTRNHNNDDQLLSLFEERNGTIDTDEKQGCHTLEAVKIMEYELKNTLVGLARMFFGSDVRFRWVQQYFPFTHPSWELEVYNDDRWLELLGCGIMRQEILRHAGAGERIGWAFGLGLERLAMCLYGIPDIRLFWSKDSGFLNQFKFENSAETVKYKPVSIYPQCNCDISFWLPEHESYSSNDFFEIVREVAGDTVEQIILIDTYTDPKTNRVSHCYTIVYRHMKRTLIKAEVNYFHNRIRKLIGERLHVTVR